ncbi:MAG: hypothetical protein WKF58_10395 [Ilumatobacteraceae bacterium]
MLVQRGRTERDWLLIKKDDDAAQGRWNPEDHPRSVKSGRTNDEVLAAPAQTWSSSASWAAPTADELVALDDLSGRARWQVGEHDVPLSGLDDVLFPATGGQRPLMRRDLVRYLATMAPAILPYLADRAIVLHRYPHGIDHDGIWHRSRASQRARLDPPLAPRRRHLRQGRRCPRRQFGRRPGVARRSGRRRAPSVAVDGGRSPAPHVGDGRHRSGRFDDVRRRARARPVASHGARSPRIGGSSEGDRPPRHPDLDPDRPTALVRGDTSLGRVALAHGRLDRARPRQLGVGGRPSRGRARLDYTQSAINKTLVAPFSPTPASGAPVSVPIEWDELDDPEVRPDRWTIDTVGARLAEHGDSLAPLVGVAQSLPELA